MSEPSQVIVNTPLASLHDIEIAARGCLSSMAYEYVSGGAGDECTLGWNERDWNSIRLRQRVLVDVAELDTSVSLLGRTLSHPILLAPTAYHKLIHADGEVATARGASEAGAPMIMSSFSNSPIEDVARATTAPFWFQLYVQPDREFTKALVQRVEAAGCEALCLTVDTPVLGARYRETRTGFHLPDGLTRANLEGMTQVAADAAHRPPEGAIYSAVLEPRLTWKDVEWLRSIATVPVLLKGIMDPDDARLAVQHGASGVIVSNHGARNLDTVPSTAMALPHVVDAIDGRVPVLVDGGIRRGTDVLKALALGASSVLIGRPYLYGLAVDGAAGVSRVVRTLRTELEMAMALTGRTSVSAIDRSVLWA
ncbi:MAG TPA: alpha-hydroxy-acid oxidizing protein [Gemmatimonas aurantiaca]|uniref:Alpha-hydroxy-acid oxidizing protein n=1 Tax=Gemmatimonas aurantiaca TaxID=173480 RepID=A0A3D4V3K8_9BACT|nr:alpha-hydroxy acid oxidase [Gemmatimonas aurantiaca]HCT55705.1 alpha-hydroxy-acid oxidizing protein [Gemmatimonas aurantiaca]